jgi:hypothetical protein
MLGNIVVVVFVPYVLEDLREEWQTVSGEHADIAKQTGDAASSEGTAREAENVNLVTRDIVGCKECVAFSYILCESCIE